MRPTRRCLLLFLLTLPVSLLPVLVGPDWLWPWILLVSGLVLLAGLDVLFGLPRRRLGLEVEAPEEQFVGEPGHATVVLTSRAALTPARIGVLLDLHADLMPQEERIVLLRPASTLPVEVPLVPLRRGTVAIERVWVRWTGPLGLMERRVTKPIDAHIAVVPSLVAVRRAALRFAKNRDVYSSQRSVRYVGEGSEFDAMREYVPGLDLRTVSWKASARHRKLICEEHRAERNHQVIVVFDTGHLMAEPLAGIPKLDHAIHTGLALAHTCLRAGDRVGLYAFDDRVRQFAQPQGGAHTFARLQRMTAQLDYSTAETNFTLGIAELSMRLHRRSLVVILTDFVDAVTARLMVENTARLVRQHLLVFVCLRDEELLATADRAPTTVPDLHRSVVAADFIRERRTVMRELDRLGVFTIDAPPRAVSTELLNRYLEIKRRELI